MGNSGRVRTHEPGIAEVIRKDLPSSLLLPGYMAGCYEVDEVEFHEYLLKEFGFTPGLIRVREFHLPEEMLAVYRFPELFQDFLKNPIDPTIDEELRQSLPGRIDLWQKEERFVLQWGNVFWLNSKGEVTDS